MVNKRLFLDEVVQHIRSKEAKKVVSKELNHHIEETKQKLIQDGETPEDAEKMAVFQMGSPIQLGQRMDKIHRPKVDWFLIVLISAALGIGFLPFFVLNEWIPSHNLLIRKITMVFIGIMILVTFMLFDYRKLRGKGWMCFLAGCSLLLMIVIGPYSVMLNGVDHLQIGTLALSTSITLPFFMIAWVDFLQKEKFAYWKYSVLVGIPGVLIAATNDLSALGLYLLMASCIIIFININYKTNFRAWIALITTWVFVATTVIVDINPYQVQRIQGFLYPEKYEDSIGYMYLSVEELMDTASWFGQPLSKEKYIPEVHTDFVFVGLTYTLGWLFSIGLIILLVSFLVRMAMIHRQIKDPFGKMLLVGSVSIFAIFLVGNIGMTLGLLPITSIPLPFISYGFEPIIMNSVIIGLVLSVFRRKHLYIPSAVE